MSQHFAAAPRDLLRDERVPNAHVITTFLAIQDHVDGLEGSCFPSHARIAELSHQSVSTVQRDIKVLIELGYLSTAAREGSSNVYDIRWSRVGQPDLAPSEGRSERPGGSVTVTDEEEPPNNNHISETSDADIEEPLSLDSSNVSSQQAAEDLVASELGGVPIEEPETPGADLAPQQGSEASESQESLPDPVGPRQAAHRVGCSRRAGTDHAIPLDRRFRPSMFGYSMDDMKRDYPSLTPTEVLESFFSHHISRGDTSKNWLEKFFSYCARGERMAQERESGSAKDSMGLPVNALHRRVGDTDEAREARRRQYEETNKRFARLNEQEEAK